MNPHDPTTWPIGTWFQNVGSATFHKEAPNWVVTGLAVCGRPIPQPAMTVTNPTPMQQLCKRCLRKESSK